MKLSWLDISEAHTNNPSIYMIWQYEQMHKIKRERERVRVNGSNANTEICFKVRAHSSTSPPSHRRIFNPLNCPHRTPTQGTSTKDLGQYNREYTTPLLITDTTSTLRGQAQSHHKSTSQMRDRHKPNTTNQPLTRGIGHKATTPKSTSTQEGQHKVGGFTTLWYISTTNQFSHK